MKPRRRNNTAVLEPEGELEDEIEPGNSAEEDEADAERHGREASKKLEHERKLKKKRNDKYKAKQRRQREVDAASASGSADVDEVLGKDPEVAKVYEQFAGKIGTADDLAGVYAMLFAPLGFFVHEDLELHDPKTGNPTAECLQLARGTWPCVRKYAGSWLAWVREHSPEVLAISTLIFFTSRKVPVVFKVVGDPSQLRINRMRAEAAAAAATSGAAKHPPPRQEGAAAAAQVVNMEREHESEKEAA
jgi:hypothetical protein